VQSCEKETPLVFLTHPTSPTHPLFFFPPLTPLRRRLVRRGGLPRGRRSHAPEPGGRARCQLIHGRGCADLASTVPHVDSFAVEVTSRQPRPVPARPPRRPRPGDRAGSSVAALDTSSFPLRHRHLWMGLRPAMAGRRAAELGELICLHRLARHTWHWRR